MSVSACAGGDGDGRADVTARDSAGIRIVEHAPADSAAQEWWQIEGEPVFEAGGQDGEDPIYRVTALHVLEDGAVLVANGGGGDLRLFDPQGTPARLIGRRGSGPGEFQMPGAIVPFAGDSLLIRDLSLARFSVFDGEGNYGRQLEFALRRPGLAGALQDGTLIGTGTVNTGGFETGMQRPDIVLYRFGEGVPPDTVLQLPGSERYLAVNRSGSNMSVNITSPPFARTTLIGVGDANLFAVTQEAPEVLVHDAGGNLVQIIRIGDTLDPVTSDMVAAEIERRVALAESDRQAEQRRALADLPAGSYVPPFRELVVAEDGALWLADPDLPDAQTNTWTVVSTQDETLARVRLPARFTPHVIRDDVVYGVQRDDFDVEHVRGYQVIR